MALISRPARLLIAALCAAAPAGCASTGGVRTASRSNEVPVSEAFIVPPPGGPAVVAVLENRFRNGLAQDIILENNSGAPGQNALYVRAFGPMGRDAGRGTLAADRPDLATIRRELAQRFPGIRMEISGLYAQNRYGALGYATGRAPSGATCLYVWQRIASERRLFKVERGSITWRLRLCEPKTTARELLITAYGFTVAGYFDSPNWNPYGPPPEPDERIGKPGAVILPEQAVDPTVVAPQSFGERRRSAAADRAARAPPARTTVRPPERPAVLNRPTPGAAVVPRPENTDLAEPEVERSNLPQAAPPANEGPGVPLPEGARPAVPLPQDGNASPRVILPRNGGNGGPGDPAAGGG